MTVTTLRRLAGFVVLGALGLWLRTWLTGPPPLRVEVGPDTASTDILARIDDEVLVAEARRLGWHRTDPVVRERLALNMRAVGRAGDDDALVAAAHQLGMDRTDALVRARLLDRARRAVATVPPPSDEALRAHLAAHPERFAGPRMVRFAQVFLSGARGATLADDADRLHRLLPDGPAAGLGDPLLLGARPVQVSSCDRLASRWGPAFAHAACDGPGVWSRVDSRWGVHFVRRLESLGPRAEPLEAVRPAVEADLRAIEGQERSRTALARMRARWQVDVVSR